MITTILVKPDKRGQISPSHKRMIRKHQEEQQKAKRPAQLHILVDPEPSDSLISEIQISTIR